MRATLNLVNQAHSNIKYEIANFPDGHKHIKLLGNFNKYSTIDITCRICNADDLFILLQIKDIFDVHKIENGYVTIYYLFTMRCDRRFSIGEANDLSIVLYTLKSIFGDNKIVLIDPHTNDTDRYIKLFSRSFMVGHFDKFEDYRICFPDEGAYGRYSKEYMGKCGFIQHITSKTPIVFNKSRDPLTGDPTIELSESDYNLWKKVYLNGDMGKILVVDDILDGGATFIDVSRFLTAAFPGIEKSVFVTHAIQPSGVIKVANCYDEVFITDSYRDWKPEEVPDNVTILKINDLL